MEDAMQEWRGMRKPGAYLKMGIEPQNYVRINDIDKTNYDALYSQKKKNESLFKADEIINSGSIIENTDVKEFGKYSDAYKILEDLQKRWEYGNSVDVF